MITNPWSNAWDQSLNPIMKPLFITHKILAASTFAFALSSAAPLMAQGNAEPAGAPETETAPAVPETGVGGAKPVQADPKMAQAEPLEAGAEVPETKLTVSEIVSGSEDFTTLAGALKAAGMTESLAAEGAFTLFAPNNAAFEKLPEGTLEMLLMPENRPNLRKILAYHVVPAKMMAKDLIPGQLQTLDGESITLTGKEGGAMTIQNAEFGLTDVNASNGVIHVVNTILMPPTVVLDAPAAVPAD